LVELFKLLSVASQLLRVSIGVERIVCKGRDMGLRGVGKCGKNLWPTAKRCRSGGKSNNKAGEIANEYVL
jgi:hypothetical protein